MNSASSLSFTYQVKRSHRAKRARIVISPAKVEVVAPMVMQENSIHRFVTDNRRWIENTLERLEMSQALRKSLAPEHYFDGSNIPYQGEGFPLKIQSDCRKTVTIEFNEVFLARVPDFLANEKAGQQIRDALVCWMKQAAQKAAEAFVAHHAAQLCLYPRSVQIKNQKSRWGSCGIHNDIYLNWVLILAPPETFEYVVVHELAHIKYRNHSADFWKLVASQLPDYQQQRNWLRVNGFSLMAGL